MRHKKTWRLSVKLAEVCEEEGNEERAKLHAYEALDLLAKEIKREKTANKGAGIAPNYPGSRLHPSLVCGTNYE